MSKINIPAGYSLVSAEAYGQRYHSLVAPDGKVIENAYEQGAPAMFAFLSALAAAPTPPVDAVLGEPVAESADAWKSRLITEACTKWSGSQKIEAGDIIEWIADFRVQAAPVASRAVQAEPAAEIRDLLCELGNGVKASNWRLAERAFDMSARFLADQPLAATAEPLSYCLNCDSPMPKGCGGCFDGQDKCARTDSSAPTSTEPPMSPDGEGPLYATPDSAGAASLAPREDTRLLDWLERMSCERMAVKLFGSQNKRIFCVELWGDEDEPFEGFALRDAIRAAIAASPAGAEGADHG